MSSNAGIAQNFRFTSNDETIVAMTASTAGGDTLIDASTTDNDVFNYTATGAMTALTAINIETANVTMASGAPTAVFTNFTGLKNVNVSGSVAGTVTDAGTATVALNGYGRVLTSLNANPTGTTAAGTAETLNFAVSGATWGSTAATQTQITIDSAADVNQFETVNLASNGAAANVMTLATNGDTIGTLNITGTQDLTLRVANNLVNGITIAAGTNTGNVNLSIDRNGATTTTTNLTNMSGVEKVTFRDSTAGGDALVATNIASGTAIDVVSNFATGSTFSVFGAATGTADSVTLTLDHATAATGTTITDLNVQNVETLNIVSNGNSGAAAGAANFIGTGAANELVGDFTSIAISGDTTLTMNLDVDAPAAGNLVTTVDASAMTGTAAFVFSAANDANATNRYSITGTANGDTLTGGVGNDTINGGAGTDTINFTAGTDTVTGGAGVDTFRALDAQMKSTGGSVSSITDFTKGTGGDVLSVDNATVGAGGIYVGAAAGLTAGTAYGVIVLTDAAYANATAASTTINVTSTSTTAAVVVYLNSTTGFVQAYQDDNLSVDNVAAANTDFAVFTNVTTLAGIQEFVAANFTVA